MGLRSNSEILTSCPYQVRLQTLPQTLTGGLSCVLTHSLHTGKYTDSCHFSLTDLSLDKEIILEHQFSILERIGIRGVDILSLSLVWLKHLNYIPNPICFTDRFTNHETFRSHLWPTTTTTLVIILDVSSPESQGVQGGRVNCLRFNSRFHQFPIWVSGVDQSLSWPLPGKP